LRLTEEERETAVRILSIDGGGYLGLAVATLLRDLEEHFQAACHRSFDLFCGTSTGAIISLGLASGLGGQQIVDLYKDLGPAVFGGGGRIPRSFRFARSFVMSKYDNRELRRALDRVFQNRTIGDLEQRGKRVLIPAFCVTTGGPRVFKTDLPPALTLHNDYRVADVALASAAAPTYFPMVKLRRPTAPTEEEVLCDGGVVANHPAILGFAEAVGQLEIPPADVALLSISTPRIDLREPLAAKRFLSRGLLRWAPSLSSALIDSGSAVMHEALRRIIRGFPEPRPLYVRLALDNTERLPMDLASPNATIVLTQIGTAMAARSTVRTEARPFFT
jgi:uncharacterized protein